jgi:hypothetical protein
MQRPVLLCSSSGGGVRISEAAAAAGLVHLPHAHVSQILSGSSSGSGKQARSSRISSYANKQQRSCSGQRHRTMRQVKKKRKTQS